MERDGYLPYGERVAWIQESAIRARQVVQLLAGLELSSLTEQASPSTGFQRGVESFREICGPDWRVRPPRDVVIAWRSVGGVHPDKRFNQHVDLSAHDVVSKIAYRALAASRHPTMLADYLKSERPIARIGDQKTFFRHLEAEATQAALDLAADEREHRNRLRSAPRMTYATRLKRQPAQSDASATINASPVKPQTLLPALCGSGQRQRKLKPGRPRNIARDSEIAKALMPDPDNQEARKRVCEQFFNGKRSSLRSWIDRHQQALQNAKNLWQRK